MIPNWIEKAHFLSSVLESGCGADHVEDGETEQTKVK